MTVTFPTDLEIARKAHLLPMPEIAARMGIGSHLLEPYGHDVAKIKLDAITELAEVIAALEILTAEVRWLARTRATTVIGLKLKASYASTEGKLADSIVEDILQL